ncbi:MAG: DUF4833 domain-containing protein, partial [Sphingobacteriaceae bacterium]
LIPVNNKTVFQKKTPATSTTTIDEYPALADNISRLFYVQRNPNSNTIIYELNVGKDGQLDKDEPVHVYWIRYAEKGQKEELNYIQRKFAYGVTAKASGRDKYDIRFVSYKKFPLTLMKGEDGKYHIFATVNQKEMALSRIFIKIEGGTFWLPNVKYVEMKGTDPSTGKEISERFKP